TTKTEAGLKEKEARCSQLEKELAGFKKNLDELQVKSTTEQQQVTVKAQKEIKDLQERLDQSTAELNAAKSASTKTEAGLKEKEARCGQLEKELAGLKKNLDELQVKSTTEQQQVTVKAQKEIKDLQERLDQSTAELNAAKSASTKTEAGLK